MEFVAELWVGLVTLRECCIDRKFPITLLVLRENCAPPHLDIEAPGSLFKLALYH